MRNQKQSGKTHKYQQYNKNLVSSEIIFLCLAGSGAPRKSQIHSPCLVLLKMKSAVHSLLLHSGLTS